MEEKMIRRSCVDCAVTACERKDGKRPDFCLTTSLNPDLLQEAIACYEDMEDQKLAIAAAEVEYEGYLKLTRVEEIIAFAGKIGAKKIGIATCVGLIRESRTLAKILRGHDLEVIGVACKIGAVEKTRIGIPEECQEIGCHMCNPVLQAKYLNKEKTDLNVVVGLCVGHDSLFYKHSDAPVTTAVTKDRVLGHNPAAALYTAESYYERML